MDTIAVLVINSSPFKPAWWLSGAHQQTIWANKIRPRPRVRLIRERIELDDGDFIDLDWNDRQTGPLILVLHGLEGSSESNYAAGILRSFSQRGWTAVMMHFRGCSGEPNRLARRYHAGDTGDLATVLSLLVKRFPDKPVFAVGYSLGGNVLLKWLGETGDNNPLTSAVSISVPYKLADCAERLNMGFSRFYQKILLDRLLHVTRKKYADRNEVDLEMINRIRTIRDFDDQVTAPLHGFRDVDHYYDSASCFPYLKKISTPTLILHARDDPFMWPSTLPLQTDLADAVTMDLSPDGGHVGFVSGSPLRPVCWLEQRIPEFIDNFLNDKKV